MEMGGDQGLTKCCQILPPLGEEAFIVITPVVPDSELARGVEYCNEDASGDTYQHVLEDVILRHCVLLLAGAGLEEEKVFWEARVGDGDGHGGNGAVDDPDQDQQVYL